MGGRSRTVPLLAAAVVLVAGLVVHVVALPGADKLGDGLYAALVVVLVWLLRPTAPAWVLAVVGLAWCWSVELLQRTSVPAAVTDRFPPARLVLGSGFDPVDLLAYALAVAVAVAAVTTARR